MPGGFGSGTYGSGTYGDPLFALPGNVLQWDAVVPGPGQTFVQYNVKRRRAAHSDAFGRTVPAGPYVRIAVRDITARAYADHHTGSGVRYEYAVTWTADVSGDVLESEEQEPPVAGEVAWRGGFIHDPADPAVYAPVLAREVGVEQHQQQTTLRARGRREDTVFVGEGFGRAYEVGVIPTQIHDRVPYERLRAMLDRQFAGATYCLRLGHSGEVVFGRLDALRRQDRTGLSLPAVRFHETHYAEAV